jgi:type II secretory pathway pseudopilin PulG
VKNSSAFTLLEVLIALFILTSAVVITADVQFRSYFRVADHQTAIENLFLIKKELYKQLLTPPAPGKRISVQLEKPNIKIASESIEINNKSSLKELKDSLHFIQTEGLWKKDGAVKTTKMICFVFKKPEFPDKKS